MAKVAKKSANSAKKSVAGTKSPVKKADKQKKAPVKVSPTAKKKAAVKSVAKKTAPVSKTVAKKVVAKKAAKPAPAPAKKVAAKKSVAPSKPIAKSSSKKTIETEAKSKTKTVGVSKKSVVAAKTKAAPVKVEKSSKVKPAAVAKVSAKENVTKKDDKKPVVAAASTDPAIAALKTATATKPRRKKKKNDDDDDDEEVVVFRKPTKAKTSAVKKTSAKYVSEELTLEGPAPRRIGVMTMTSDEKIKLKKALLNKCIDIQKNTVAIAKKAMEDALTSANAEKVTEELSDSFRESMHATRDMYARQANEGVNNLGLLNRINIIEHEKVKFGSVVFTNFQNYFISTGLGEIKVDDVSFQAVSTLAPLFQILVDKKKGDTFMFLDRLYTVIEVF